MEIAHLSSIFFLWKLFLIILILLETIYAKEGYIEKLPVPNFFIIGAAKSGTSSLFRLLQELPEICNSKVKELHYFDHKMEQGKEWYLSKFADCHKNQYTMDGTPR